MASTINGTQTGNGGLVTTGDDSGILQLQTNETTAVTIDASQNVGIGTSSPTEKLTVSSSSGTPASFRPPAGGYNGLEIFNGTNGVKSIGFNDAAQSTLAIYQYNSSGNFVREAMRIDSSGNLLVGCTTSPSSGASYGCFINPRYAQIKTDTTSTYGVWEFYNPNGSVGKINTSGSSTAYATSSDYRLKENVQPMTGALSVVAQLNPVTYTWKADGSEGQGFIAHELQEVVPDCVTGDKDAVDADGNPVHQGIDTSFLVATLTAAIQELKAELDAAKERITALEGATQ